MRCADFRVFSLRVQGPQPLPPTAQVILPSPHCSHFIKIGSSLRKWKSGGNGQNGQAARIVEG
jgi:hypothetical protein